MPAEVETMFYAGEVPWHGLGVPVEEAQTSAEAIHLAGLDWEVSLGPLYGPNYSEVEGRFAIYRTSDSKVLGISSDRYTPLQNAEAFAFLDSLHQDGVLRYETAGSLKGGRRIFLLARLEEGMRIRGEEYHPYLLLSSGHDVSTSVRVLSTTVRVVCQNTLQAALGGGGGIRVIHTPALQERLQQASETLQLITAANDRMRVWLEALAEIQTPTYDGFVGAIRQDLTGALGGDEPGVTPHQRKQGELFDAILACEYARSDSAYAVAAAITGFVDHGMRYIGGVTKEAESRMLSLTDGYNAGRKVKALQMLAYATDTEALLTA